MNNEPIYCVPEHRLLELLEAEARLEALEMGGVDDWEWYGDSLHDWLENYFAENSPYKSVYDSDYMDVARDAIKNFSINEVK